MNERIVITGLGTLSALGSNTTEFWNALSHGRSAIMPITPSIDGINISVGARLTDYDSTQYFSSDELSLLDYYSQFAIIAASEALADAGLSMEDEAVKTASAVIGSGCGGKHTDEETYLQLYKKQRTRVHPLTIPKGMPSAAASMVSRHLGIKGSVFSLASACASSAHAIAQGSLMIQAGYSDIALVGGTDAPFTYGLLKAWEALRVVSRDTCRPFSKDRSGMVLGEGAGMLVLESESHARQRGAHIYAELAACAMSSDAGHITRPDVDGLSNAMKKALQLAGLVGDEIDYINAHGTATQMNDIAETQAIHNVFGNHVKDLPVSSTKSMHGHVLGASSALELIATLLAMSHGCLPPTANFTQAGESCDLDYVPLQPRTKEIQVAMSNSFAFGGLNAVLVVKKHH